MLAAKQESALGASRPAPVRWLLGAVALVVFAAPATLEAAAPRHKGLFISVANPITEGVVTALQNKIDDARLIRGAVIIFDFNPTGAPSATSDPYVCIKFADYLTGLRNTFHTVAYVHSEVTQHTVLPVLACTELVMSDSGEIGDVQRGQQGPPSETTRFAYEKVAKLRNPLTQALVLKMLDKNLAVVKGKARNGAARFVGYYRDNRGKNKDVAVAAARKSKDGFTPDPDAPDMEPGTARFSASDALKYGLASRKDMASREQVARAFGVPPASLREDVLQGQVIHPWLIEFPGPVNDAKVSWLRRKIDRAVSKGANFIILQLECQTGTDTQAAVDLAEYLRDLKDDKDVLRVKTVAYIPAKTSIGAGTAIALGCSEIMMGKAEGTEKGERSKEDAVLGDFDYLKNKEAGDYRMARLALVGLAKKQWYPPVVIQGTLDKDLIIWRVRTANDPDNHFLVSEEELAKHPEWVRENKIKDKGEFLKLDADRAVDYGVAHKVVHNLDELYRHYGIKAEEVRRTGSDVLDMIEEFFQNPLVRILLVMIGIVGLILEMKMPGVGLPGVVAAVCFVLYFWANSSLGHFTWLAVMLFVLGILLIGLEVFFLPGMAVFGISGVVLVVASLVLVTLEKAPTTSRDWWSLGMTQTTYTLSLVGAIVVAFLVARYLPQIPYANRLVLVPPAERPEPAGEEHALTTEVSAALLGAIGEAATNLRPAGMARFGDDYLDVVAEGSFVNAGKRIQVIEIEGNRIVVKEV
jgi:membrane-bound ClpP family serine protease